ELGFAASATPLVYGIVAVRHGGYWLPNSIALKGAAPGSLAEAPLRLAYHFGDNLLLAPYMGILLLIMVALLAVPRLVMDRRARPLLEIVLGASLLHLTLANVDWGYRYEAYLIGAAVVAISLAVSQVTFSEHRWAAATLALLGGLGLWMLSARTASAE